MPTVLLIKGYRFFFYSHEGNEPMHIHIEKADAEAKVWLKPEIKTAFFIDFSKREQREIIDLTKQNYETLKQKWNEYFSK